MGGWSLLPSICGRTDKSWRDPPGPSQLSRFMRWPRRPGSGKIGFLGQFFQKVASNIVVSGLQKLQPRQQVFRMIRRASDAFEFGDNLALLRDLTQPVCDPLLNFRQTLLETYRIHVCV